jgi:Ca2+:H+ antiporter
MKLSWGKLSFYILLAFAPLSLILSLVGASSTFVFLSSILAIIPFAKLIGEATGELEKTSGPATGSLLNASFGNAAELIIAISAIRAGLVDLVKASITGSILGNTLLIFGMSMFFGNLKHKDQGFNRDMAGLQASMLFIALLGLALPTIFFETTGEVLETQFLSDAVALLLITVYVLSLIFTLSSHKHLFSIVHAGDAQHSPAPAWSRRKAVLVLLLSMGVVAVISEVMVSSVGNAASRMQLSEMFVGAVIVAVIGNAAEHSSAITFALQNRLDMSIGIAANSSTQIALFVVPLLVFAGLVQGNPITLVFSVFELIAIFFAAAILNLIGADGRSNWFEGVQLISVYLLLATAFFFL